MVITTTVKREKYPTTPDAGIIPPQIRLKPKQTKKNTAGSKETVFL